MCPRVVLVLTTRSTEALSLASYISIRRLARGVGGPEAPPALHRSFSGRVGRGDVRRSRTQCTPRTRGGRRPGPLTEASISCVTAALAPWQPPGRRADARRREGLLPG
jgi:hypothetical protein